MKDIINKFIIKTENDKSTIYFLYNGNKINEKLSFQEQANEIDNQRKKMNIIMFDNVDNNNNVKKVIKSKDNICPICKENIFPYYLKQKRKDNEKYIFNKKNLFSFQK